MKSDISSLKPWQELLFAVLIMGVGLWVGWRGLGCFDYAGRWWRGRVKDSFVETQARVDKVWSTRVKSKNSTIGVEILIEGHYQIRGVVHRFVDVEEMEYGRDDEKMAAKAEQIRRTRPMTRVFYDPANPAYAVLKKDNLPGFFSGALLCFFGGIIELVALALVMMGLAGIGNHVLSERARNYLCQFRLVYLKSEQLKPEPPLHIPSPLTGDDKADYYSHALRDHALGCWPGFWCEVFLMQDHRIVVCHDDSTHHYFRTWSIDDVLAGNSDILFDDNQQAERESFFHFIREQHG